MPHLNNEIDSYSSADSPDFHIRHGELTEETNALATTGRRWLGSAQDSRSVPSTAGSIKSDSINTTDAEVYSYREEWDLSVPSSEPTTSRSIDEGCDCGSNNADDSEDESDSKLQSSDLETSPRDLDELQPALHDDGVYVDQSGLDAVAGELGDSDASLEESHPQPAFIDKARETVETPASVMESPQVSPGGVIEPNDCAASDSTGSDKAASTSSDIQDGETRRIQVLVRVRPPTGSADDKVVVAVGELGTSIQIQSSNNHGILGGSLGAGGMTTVTECAFDRVFGPSATQEDLFSAVEPSVRAAIDGYNATVFAYGQTGTGKTHTLFGKDFDTLDAAPSLAGEKCSGVSKSFAASPRFSNAEPQASPATAPTWGVVPRALRLLLTYAARLEADSAAASERQQVSLRCSFVQIYNDRLFDLFTDRRRQKPLLLREQPRADGSTNVVVQGLSSELVVSVPHALQLLRRGIENRSVRETESNLASSRSHAIVQVNITIERSSPTGERTTRTSRLNLVDLAGSEKWNTDIPMDDAHSLELKNINASLSALGNCIAALAEPGRRHIPFRDSTLTRVLQDSLGGNTQSCLIATVSPSLHASEETIRTLQFADRARSVMQTVRINEASGSTAVLMTTELLVARSQIAKLREKLESTQRRHNETRLKELETCQRKFSEALKEKDRELSKLSRENAGFLKWKEEDARRIRELEAQVRELEDERSSRVNQSTSSAAVNMVDDRSERTWSENNHEGTSDSVRIAVNSPLSPVAGANIVKTGAPTRVRRNDSAREMQRSTSKANLPRLASNKSRDAPQGSRTYKQLLERYALQMDKGKRDREADRLPSATPPPETTSACELQSSDAAWSPCPALPQSSLKDVSFSASSPLLPIATRIPRASPRDLSVVASTKSSMSGVVAMTRSSSSLPPPLMESDAIQALCEAAACWEGSAPTAAAVSSSAFAQRVEVTAFRTPPTEVSSQLPTKVTSGVMEAWRGATTSGASQDASLPGARRLGGMPAVCAKHSLRGCVLCSNGMSSNQSQPVVASQAGSTPSWSSQTDVTCLVNADEPCGRHRLSRCFICSKTAETEGLDSSGSVTSSKTVAVYPGGNVASSTDWYSDRMGVHYGSATSAKAPSAATTLSATSSIGMSVLPSKCSAHSLSNCILCSNKSASSSSASNSSSSSSNTALFSSSSGAGAFKAQALSSAHAEYPARRYTLDARLLGLPSPSLSSSSSSHPSTPPDSRVPRYPQQPIGPQALSTSSSLSSSGMPLRYAGWPQTSAWNPAPS
jgi:predicted nuclease with TOPRIM domain